MKNLKMVRNMNCSAPFILRGFSVSHDLRRRTYFMLPGHLTKFQSMKGPRDAGANGVSVQLPVASYRDPRTDTNVHCPLPCSGSSDKFIRRCGPDRTSGRRAGECYDRAYLNQRVEVLAAHAINKTVYVLDSKKGLRK